MNYDKLNLALEAKLTNELEVLRFGEEYEEPQIQMSVIDDG